MTKCAEKFATITYSPSPEKRVHSILQSAPKKFAQIWSATTSLIMNVETFC